MVPLLSGQNVVVRVCPLAQVGLSNEVSDLNMQNYFCVLVDLLKVVAPFGARVRHVDDVEPFHVLVAAALFVLHMLTVDLHGVLHVLRGSSEKED